MKKEKSSNKSEKEDVNILKRYFTEDKELDETDRFLRKFILTKGWIDKDDLDFNDDAD